MTLKEFEAEPGKIPLHEFLALCHRWTERVRIRVVMGDGWLKFEEAAHLGGEWVLTDNAFAEEDGKWPELERLLKYYAEAPVWNIVARLFQPLTHLMNRKAGKTGDLVGTAIEVHVHYEDIREGFLAEKDAIRRRKRREYRQRAKNRPEVKMEEVSGDAAD